MTQLLNSEIIAKMIHPIVNTSFDVGDDIRYEPEFELIENEILKLNSMHKENKPDYSVIYKSAFLLIQNKTKNLRLVCWLSYAVYRINLYEDLSSIFDLLRSFLDKYSKSLYPKKKGQQLAVLNWLFDRISVQDDDIFDKKSDEYLNELIHALLSCDEILSEVYQDDAPSLRSKYQFLKDILKRRDIDKKTEAPLSVAKPVEQPLQITGNPSNTGVQSANLTVVQPITSSVTDDSDVMKIGRYVQEQSRLMIQHFLQKNLADPRAYLLTRSSVWLQVTGLPKADTNKKTLLKPLSANKLQEYQQRFQSKDFQQLLPELEVSLTKAPFWLDGHHLSAQITQALGYADISRLIQMTLQSWVSQYPEMPDYCFDDGTAFANAETKAWLTQTSENPSMISSVSSHDASHEIWRMALETAEENMRNAQSDVKAELKKLHDFSKMSSSGKEQFSWKMAMLAFSQKYQRDDVVNIVAEEICQLVHEFNLSLWEPALVKDFYLKWIFSLERKNKKDNQNKIDDVKEKLYRLDVSFVF